MMITMTDIPYTNKRKHYNMNESFLLTVTVVITGIAVWNKGKFAGDYRTFHQAIQRDVMTRNPNQTPQIIQYGTPNPQFLDSAPFSA